MISISSTSFTHLFSHSPKKDPDPDITRIRQELAELKGALVFALETKVDEDNVDYWTLIYSAGFIILSAFSFGYGQISPCTPLAK